MCVWACVRGHACGFRSDAVYSLRPWLSVFCNSTINSSGLSLPFPFRHYVVDQSARKGGQSPNWPYFALSASRFFFVASVHVMDWCFLMWSSPVRFETSITIDYPALWFSCAVVPAYSSVVFFFLFRSSRHRARYVNVVRSLHVLLPSLKYVKLYLVA